MENKRKFIDLNGREEIQLAFAVLDLYSLEYLNQFKNTDPGSIHQITQNEFNEGTNECIEVNSTKIWLPGFDWEDIIKYRPDKFYKQRRMPNQDSSITLRYEQ